MIGYFKDETGNYTLDEKVFVGMSFLAVLCCGGIMLVDGRRSNLLKKSARDAAAAIEEEGGRGSEDSREQPGSTPTAQ